MFVRHRLIRLGADDEIGGLEVSYVDRLSTEDGWAARENRGGRLCEAAQLRFLWAAKKPPWLPPSVGYLRQLRNEVGR